MNKNLFVGGLPFELTQEQLQQAFAAFGEVRSVKIIFDRASGASRGFGFVEMATEEGAGGALAKMNGATLGGRAIVVTEARPKEPAPAERRGGWDRPARPPVDNRPLNEKRLRLLKEHEPPKTRPDERKRPWQENKPRAFGHKKPWERKPAGPGERKPWDRTGEKKPWSKPGERKPWDRTGEKKTWSKPGERKPWDKPGEKKPWAKPGERGSWGKPSAGKAPWRKPGAPKPWGKPGGFKKGGFGGPKRRRDA